MRRKEHFEEQKILNSKKKEILSKLLVIKERDMGRRKPKRLKTGDKAEEEVVLLKVRVKVKSDDDEEEESLDNDADEDKEEEEQPAQPVVRIEWPAYVAPRPEYILMDYDKSMFETVIPDNKAIRPIELSVLHEP
jgi:hypothetical protein